MGTDRAFRREHPSNPSALSKMLVEAKDENQLAFLRQFESGGELSYLVKTDETELPPGRSRKTSRSRKKPVQVDQKREPLDTGDDPDDDDIGAGFGADRAWPIDGTEYNFGRRNDRCRVG